MQLFAELEVPVEEQHETVLLDEVVDPGETIKTSETFHFSRIDPSTLGWKVEFTYSIRRRWPFRGLWFFRAPTFVAVPVNWSPTPEN